MRKMMWMIGIGVAVLAYGIGVGLFAVKNHYAHLENEDGQPAAEHFLGRFALIVVIVLGIGLLALTIWIGRFLKRFLEGLEAQFEASIAHLPPEEQDRRRRNRQLQKIMLAWAAYAIVHEGLEIHTRRQRERMRETRERQDRITAIIDQARESRRTWS